jgi:hypothetical protein
MIEAQFSRIRSLPGENFIKKRMEAINKVERLAQDPNRTIAPIDFNPHLPKASEVFQKHHRSMLISAPHLEEMFPTPPMPAYRQPDNVRKIICKSKLYPLNRATRLKRQTHKEAPGWKRCGKPCKICPFTMGNTSAVVATASGYIHTIKEQVSCDTTNCIYYWKCVKENCPDFPECEYVGMTSRQFKDRLSEHRDYPKRDVVT